ncbi:fimbrial protein [Trabulsiella odontotermitis]|uniref:fimbrial protein n=1 Tax=Trabulsiella odontotermitis TaxID=379893 RepID=UPI0024B81BB1|nr:fimbrial protein [Trabulsiella odontotermitis]WHP33066.1 fimbrial protein [Trabulsiella odontotermitis]
MSLITKVTKVSLLALCMAAAGAQAADDGVVNDDGGVTLLGHVYAGTCTVTTDGQSSTDTIRPEVTMPSVLVADTSSASVGDLVGDGYTPFKIEISNCASDTAPRAIQFNKGVYGSDAADVSSYKNAYIGKGGTPVATGVNAAIVSLDAPTAAVAFNTEIPLVETSDSATTGADYVGSVTMGAQFIKTAATVTSGAFQSIATFDIVYQ